MKRYSNEHKTYFLKSKLVNIEILNENNVSFVCPECKKEFSTTLGELFTRAYQMKSVCEGTINQLPCKKCSRKFIGNVPEVKKRLVDSMIKNNGDNFYDMLNKKSKEAIIEKYGSFKEMIKNNWDTYYEKTGFKHNMLNPEINKLVTEKRRETIRTMSYEKKQIWNKRRLEAIGERLFGGIENAKKTKCTHSKKADMFFVEFNDKLAEFGFETFFGNNEKVFYGPKKYSYYKIDFFITDLNLCIEFLGDFWHANPKYYKGCDIINYPKGLIKAEKIWSINESRENFLKENYNLSFINVWESDVDENREKIMEELVNKVRSIVSERKLCL